MDIVSDCPTPSAGSGAAEAKRCAAAYNRSPDLASGVVLRGGKCGQKGDPVYDIPGYRADADAGVIRLAGVAARTTAQAGRR